MLTIRCCCYVVSVVVFILQTNKVASIWRASDRSRKKVKFRGIFRDKIAQKSADFVRIFGTNFAGKRLVKKQRILWSF